LADTWVGGPPEIGDRYRFRIDKSGSSWLYTLTNVTEGWSSTKTIPRSSGFDFGNLAWWAAETYDRGSMLGAGQASASMINMYWMQYRRTALTGWQVVTPGVQYHKYAPHPVLGRLTGSRAFTIKTTSTMLSGSGRPSIEEIDVTRSRRRLGLGVALAFLAVSLTAAAVAAGSARAVFRSPVDVDRVVQEQPVSVDAAPAAEPASKAEKFTLTNEPGSRIEPATGSTDAGAKVLPPEDISCPGLEPCGP
jgi:hypothetical protein